MRLIPQTALERAVVRWLKNTAPKGEEKTYLRDLLQHGCQSGMVSNLIYYHDTCRFYRRHKTEISQLLTACIEDGTLRSPADLRDWEPSDPLAIETNNQNILAWFGFEESARTLAARAGFDI